MRFKTVIMLAAAEDASDKVKLKLVVCVDSRFLILRGLVRCAFVAV